MNDGEDSAGVEIFLDEQGLRAANQSVEFSTLSSILRVAEQDGMRPLKRSSIYEAAASSSECVQILDLLFTPGSLDEDLRLALVAQIDALADWDYLPKYVAFANNVTSEVARQLAMDGAAVLCIVVENCNVDEAADRFYVASSVNGLDIFYRSLPELLDLDQEAYIENCGRAYRSLVFKPGISGEIRRFSRPYGVMRPLLSNAFAALNDILLGLLESAVEPGEIAARFSSSAPYEISTESVNTRRNARAMRERKVVYNGSTFLCLWHLKFEPRRDRVHFHLPNDKIGHGNEILIGIFCDHLIT